MITKSVAISGTVGKQVFPTSGTGNAVILKGLTLSPLSAAAYVRIRSGNASGTIVYEGSAPANGFHAVALPDAGYKFNIGMHVKVLGTGAVCYLWVD